MDEAISYYSKAYNVVLDTLGANDHNAARLINEIASCYKAKNQPDIALGYYQKSLAVLDKLERIKFYDQTRWYAYVDMAEIYLEKGDKAKVLYYANKAIKINEQYNLLDDYKTWALLGKLYQKEKDHEKALTYFNQQKKAAEVEFSIYRKHPQIALAIASIAGVYADMGEYANALQSYQTSLQTIAVGFKDKDYRHNPSISQFVNKSDGLDILAGKAAALTKAYHAKPSDLAKLEAAHDCYQLITELVQSIRQGFLAEGSKHTLSERALPLLEKAVEVAVELHQATKQDKYLEHAFAYAESNKAVLLYESIRDQMAKGFAGIPDSLLEKERDLLSEIAFYEKKILESQQKLTTEATSTTNKWESKVFDLKDSYNKLRKLLETQYPDYFSLKYKTDPATLKAIRQQLPGENTALIEYMVGDQNCYAFVLTSKALKVFNLGSRSTLLASLQPLREILSTPPNSARFREGFTAFAQYSNALFDALLGKALVSLPSKFKNLVIVPDDLLCFLPFEVLLIEKANSNQISFSPNNLAYLFEQYAVDYSYSATLLALHQERKISKDAIKFLGFAPSFGPEMSENRACTADHLYSLQCNRREVEDIRSLLQGKAVTTTEASIAAFMKQSTDCDILHLATHACIDETSPLLSKIFFSDGYLTPSDVNNLRLHNALTVLSACNTGTGVVLKGEGVISLTRSFLLAGSASVLTSLWSVDDCATSDIMLQYYQGLEKGWPKDRALQQAKLAYLAAADENNSHPYYWAAFVQFGDTLPLHEKSGLWWKCLLAAVVLGLVVWLFRRKK